MIFQTHQEIQPKNKTQKLVKFKKEDEYNLPFILGKTMNITGALITSNIHVIPADLFLC